MKGKHHVVIESPRLKYEFEIKRNITIIQGDSATGKTTLVDLIRDFKRGGNNGLLSITSDCTCAVFDGNDENWKEYLLPLHNAIVFIDEGYHFIGTKEFADYIQKTDNYYVLITREPLKNLPYSVKEIYGIRTTGKFHFPEQIYHEFYPIYNADTNAMMEDDNQNVVIISEDSQSGFQFLKKCSLDRCECISSAGNSNIYATAVRQDKEKTLIIVVDGAAFGAYMEKVMTYISRRKNVLLYLPESFEWIILKAGILQIPQLKDILENAYDYIYSEQYFSWEQYFTDLLIKSTKDNAEIRYQKERLPVYYLEGRNKEKIQKVFPKEIQCIFQCK